MEYWQTQSEDQPLYPDLLWSRPQNKRQAGKLLIIGGHAQEFAQVAAAYEASQKAGAGTIKILMPASLEKLAGMIPGVEFAPANSIGSFAQSSLAELLDAADWADAVLLAGDFGKNSETAAVLDKFLAKNKKLLIISDGSLHSIGLDMGELADIDADLVIDFKSLQKLGTSLRLEKPFISTMVNNVLAEELSKLSKDHRANIITLNDGQAWVASRGSVTNTKLNYSLPELSAYCAVWHMQHKAKPLEALTSACYQLLKPRTE
jgi:hypothetical protein